MYLCVIHHVRHIGMEEKISATKTAMSETTSDSGLTRIENSKTGHESSLTATGKGLTETNNSKTKIESVDKESVVQVKAAAKVGRPIKPGSTTAVTWSIRGVERETRAMLEKAAARANKTLGQYFNEEVRAFAQGQLTQTDDPQLPASPRDLQTQVEQLTQIVEGIAARLAEPARKTLWQRVFSK